jgi:predicted glycosyltransferase
VERETEQLLRAECLAARGVAELVRESELSPGRLASAIERAAVREPVPIAIDADGATRSARLLAAMIGAGTHAAADLAGSPGRDILRQ